MERKIFALLISRIWTVASHWTFIKLVKGWGWGILLSHLIGLMKPGEAELDEDHQDTHFVFSFKQKMCRSLWSLQSSSEPLQLTSAFWEKGTRSCSSHMSPLEWGVDGQNGVVHLNNHKVHHTKDNMLFISLLFSFLSLCILTFYLVIFLNSISPLSSCPFLRFSLLD